MHLNAWARPLEHPIRSLTLLFISWKLLLLLVAAASPGPGYDTSTTLSLSNQGEGHILPSILYHVSEKLTRWDGIYFVTVARRGYVYEQEWAFGFGFTKLTGLCSTGLRNIGVAHYEGLESLVASSIAHVAHLFSVIVLFKLTMTIFGRASKRAAFTTATLQILSPAGLFLSAPYTESSCAFLSFAGCLNFAKSFGKDGRASGSRDVLLIFAGVMFGAATTFRSNGILSGILLLEEAVRLLLRLQYGLKIETVRRLIATGIGGIFVAAGFVLPQFVAYRQYCGELGELVGKRPWCDRTLPSIYTFVQDYYWSVGLFRYWTLSNLPLFLLAAPMYAILTASGLWALKFDVGIGNRSTRKEQSPQVQQNPAASRILRSLGISQLLLVGLTLSTAHVQIITRIASAYPVWLWYTAISSQGSNSRVIGHVVQFVVMYALIQGGLFASFLPPA